MAESLPGFSFKEFAVGGNLFLTFIYDTELTVSGGLAFVKEKDGSPGLYGIGKLSLKPNFDSLGDVDPFSDDDEDEINETKKTGAGDTSILTIEIYIGIELKKHGNFSISSNDSWFVFAKVHDLPFVFRGVVGGYGRNRMFKFPDFEDLDDFPLLPKSSSELSLGYDFVEGGLSPENKSEEGRQKALANIMKELKALNKFIYPKQGIQWVAFGLEFLFADFLTVGAMGVIRWGGKKTAWSILGNINAGFPKQAEEEEKVMVVDVNFEVSNDPNEGAFQILAKLTDESYLKAGKYKVNITGGIAVIHYYGDSKLAGSTFTVIGPLPMVFGPDGLENDMLALPPISLKTKVGGSNSQMVVSGSGYFGLTPQVFAFGISFKASILLYFKVKGVQIRLQVDVKTSLDYLKNFLGAHYYAAKISTSISFGIKVGFIHLDLSLSFSVGVEDFGNNEGETGGTLSCDFSVGTYKQKWGIDKPEEDFADYEEMSKLIPTLSPSTKIASPRELTDDGKDADCTSISIAAGADKTFNEKDANGKDTGRVLRYILNPFHFEIATETKIPGNRVTALGTDVNQTTRFVKYYATPNMETNEKNQEIRLKDATSPTFIQQNNAFDSETDPGNTPFLNANRVDKQHIGFSPMGIKIDSQHEVHIYKTDGDQEEIKDLIVQIQTGNFPQGTYGHQRLHLSDSSQNDYKNKTINQGLKGIKILPPQFHPARTKSVIWYLLIYDQGNVVNLEGTNTYTPLSAPEDASYYKSTEIDLADESSISALRELDQAPEYFKLLNTKGGGKAALRNHPLSCTLARESNQTLTI